MFKKRSTIALLTDFGTRDGYAGSLKGVLLGRNKNISLVDITHEITPGNVLSAAYVLAGVWDYFPKQTIFLCVVDPGVGTTRKALIAQAKGKTLIAPDNGIISLLFRLKGAFPAFELRMDWLKSEPCATFHGRDIFAPAAALVSLGKHNLVRGGPLKPVELASVCSEKTEKTVRGQVIHIDAFGNAVTSIHENDLGPDRDTIEVWFSARGKVVAEPFSVRLIGVKRTFADVPDREPLAYIGSMGFLEIGVRGGNARAKYLLRQGARVSVR